MQRNNNCNTPTPNPDGLEKPPEGAQELGQQPAPEHLQQPAHQPYQEAAQEKVQQPAPDSFRQSIQSNASIPPFGTPLPPTGISAEAPHGPKENFIKRQYKESWQFFKNHLKWIFLGVALFFVLFIVLTGLYFVNNIDQVYEIIDAFRESLKDIDLDSSSGTASGVFLNNLRACAMGWVLGFIPFLFLPAFILLANATIMGALSGVYALNGMSVAKMYIFGIMPHGIFELPAIFLSIAMGLYTCYSLVIRICEAKYHRGQVKYAAVNCLRLYLCFVFPLLIVAGFIEGFITPKLIDAFML